MSSHLCQNRKGGPATQPVREFGSWRLARLYVLGKGGRRQGQSSKLFPSTHPSARLVNYPKRYYGTNELHFINCSCYHRHPWLAAPKRRDLFLSVLERVRQRYRFVVVGYVVMPDHIHLLISEPERGDPSRVMQAVKQGLACRVC